MWDMTRWCVWWLADICDMTRRRVRHDPLICATWLVDMCDMTRWYVWHDSLICVTWLVVMCDMTRWYVWHDSLSCATWLNDICDMSLNICDMTRWHVWNDSLTWLVDMCDMTCCHVRHDSIAFVTCLLIQLESLRFFDEKLESLRFLGIPQKSPIKETIFCKETYHFQIPRYGVATISSLIRITGYICIYIVYMCIYYPIPRYGIFTYVYI